jgi:IS1 family transposase
MNRLPLETRVRVLSALCEGMSIRATVRMTGVAKNTIQKLLHDVGMACDAYQDRVMRDLKCRRIQADEIWSFCYSKERNVPNAHKGEVGYGSVYTWVALDEETKLVPCWTVGDRNYAAAYAFTRDLASRMAHRIQLSTDGLKLYIEAVEDAFGYEVDYGMLIKIYGEDLQEQPRYSQPNVTGIKRKVISGNPDLRRVGTSHIERQNLTMRMCMRRFTRLTNAFSKKIENHSLAISLHFMYYNFVRKHQSLGTTPAVAAGVAEHAWTLHQVAMLPDVLRDSEAAA